MQQALQTVADHGTRFHQPLAIGNQSTQLPHRLWRYPHFGKNICDEQADQSFDIFLICLHSRFCDLPYPSCMGHYRISSPGLHNIVDVPDIGGGFNHHGITLTQVLPNPLPKLAEFDPASWQAPFLTDVHAADKHVFLVNIYCDVSLNGSCPWIYFHATLLLVFVDWGAYFWVRAA